MSVWYQQSMNTFQQHVEILTTCFHSRRSRSCYDRCALISVHLSRGSKQNASIVSSFILPMFWLLWINHEAWCKSSQSWVVLLLMSIRTISINTLFLREHMCNEFQKYVKQALLAHPVQSKDFIYRPISQDKFFFFDKQWQICKAK